MAGDIRLVSVKEGINIVGHAFQANAKAGGSVGGTVVLLAFDDIILQNTIIEAQGDLVAMGGFGEGGEVEIDSFNGSQFWSGTSLIDVLPTGANVPAAKRGVVTLGYVLVLDVTGLSIASNGSATTPNINQHLALGEPSLPDGVVLPDCCGEQPPPPPAPDPGAIPEPAGLTLAGLAVLLASRRRRA